MNDSYKFDRFDPVEAVRIAKEYRECDYTDAMGIVLTIAFHDIRNLPSLRFSNKNTIQLQEYVPKWVDAYLKGYKNRPSVRVGKQSNTFSDPIVKITLQARLPDIDDALANQIEGGHALMMTIENLVGDLLEEYLSDKLGNNGWFCCWGSTIDAVDFCKADGSLLQIKNSDNSENSSSSRVRAGTTIEKWYRRKSTKADTFLWNTLNQMLNRNDLSEADFRSFVKRIATDNPNCLFTPEI